jgi:hypothetical protein
VSDAQEQADFDLDEDLFDFGGVVQESDSEPEESLEEIFASFRDAAPAEDLLAIPAAPSAPREPRQAPAAAPARAPAPALAHVPAFAPRTTRFAKGAVAIALSVTVLNSVLAVVMLRGRPPAHDVKAVASTSDEPASAPEQGTHALPDPESVVETHDHPTLDAAREEITHGEYAAARQRVYGLLAIIDRLEDPRRGTLEAECQFLIAQSLHLEALGRMGGPE